ncbi:MAG: sulfatase [Phycisphaeraceae bacterium]
MKVILLDLDTLRPDRMSCYGHGAPTTPNLDRLAERGVRYTRSHCVDSPCIPSRASLVAGRYGVCHGAIDFGTDSQFFRPTPLEGRTEGQRFMDELTLPFALFKQRVRCATVSTFGKHPAAFFFHGWDQVITPHEPDGPELADLLSEEQRREHDLFNPQCEGMQTVRGEQVVDEAIDWVNRYHDDDFFLHVHLWDPHTPYAPPAEDLEAFADTPDLPFPRDEQLGEVKPARFRDRGKLHKALQHYDAEIHYADRQVGRLIDRIEELGLTDDTVFIMTSDHGEEFGEKGICIEHGSVYEGTARIPLIIAGPGIEPGVCDSLVGNVDIAPTVMGLFGRPCPAEWQGVDLKPTFADASASTRDELLLSHAVFGRQRALIRGRHKLVRTYEPFHGVHVPGHELYDLENDPHEQHDIVSERPAVAVELQWAMDRIVTELLRGRPDPLLTRHGQPTWKHQTDAQRRVYR